VKQAIEAIVGRAFLRSPAPILRAFAGKPVVRDGRTLDLQVQAAIRAAKMVGWRPTWKLSIEASRADMERSGVDLGPHVRGVEREDRTIGGFRTRIYRPKGERPKAGLLFFHGGGFVIGSIESHDLACAALAKEARCTVISAHYRLAPEHPFPAAPDDALATFRAIAQDAKSFGLDPRRIAIGGDSAGGNLSAVLALDTRSDDLKPCFQMLIYPAVDLTQSFPSIDIMSEGFFLEKKSMTWFTEHYLGSQDKKDPRVSPWFAKDLSGLPPALVATAGFDPLRDEGDAYAKRLRESGVKVEHKTYGSLVHGFWNLTGVIREARRAFDECANALASALGT
jgi:acetyl esterase